MDLLAILLVLTIFDTTIASKGSSLDVALETVLEFNDELNPDVLDKLKSIVSDIRHTFLDPKENTPDKPKKPYKFVDFLKDVILATNSFKDEQLVQILNIIHSEINQLDLEDVDYLKGYFKSNVANMKRDARKARDNLNNLLNNLRNTNKRKDNFYLNFINSLYKRNSEQKFLNILNRLNVFHRRSQTNNELREFIQAALRELVSELNLTDEKRRILRVWYDEYKRNLIRDRNLTNIDNYQPKSKIPTYKLKLKETKRGRIMNLKYFNEKQGKTNENRIKLTHITLYPENLQMIDKKNFKMIDNRKIITDKPMKRSEYRGDYENRFKNDKIDVRKLTTDTDDRKYRVKTTHERLSTSEESSKNEEENDAKVPNNGITDDVEENTEYITTHRNKISIPFRYKTKKTRKLQNVHVISKPNYDSAEKRSSLSVSDSYEQFGSLHEYSKHTNKNNIVFKSNMKTLKKKSTSPYNNVFKPDINRRANYAETKIEDKETTLKPVTNKQLNKILSSTLKNISRSITSDIITSRSVTSDSITSGSATSDSVTARSVNSRRNAFLTNNTDVISKTITENLTNSTNISITNKNYLLTTQINPSKDIQNTTTLSTITSEATILTTFDVNKYIKNSDIQDIENSEKKKLIEQKMKEDLDSLFSTSTTTTTTEAYADIFKDMEDEFGLT